MSGEPLSPFAPFQPQGAAPLVPETPAQTEETPKQKTAREKRETKAAIKKNAETDRAVAAQPDKATRRLPAKNRAAPKFDLQTTLAAAKMLNEDDFALFEKAVVMFDEAGKPQRDRVLAAIGKVFG